MRKVGFLGLGAMGSRMAANLLKAGHTVTVWNRSPAAGEALVASGARRASSPKEAAEGADFVLAIVRDDIASQNVWLDSINGAIAGMHPGVVAIESSTLTPEWIRELSEHLRAKGISLLDAPVSGSRPQAEAAQLVYLIGGDAKALSAAEPLLKVLGSSIQHVGPIGAGSLAKLTTNTLLGVQVDTIAELIGMLQRQGVDPKQILDAVASTPVWSTVAGRIASSMLSGTFAPQFPIELIEKDFSYTVHTAEGEDTRPPSLRSEISFAKPSARVWVN
jgi:3-hydroxyisobutyrate dehydrogenase